MQITATSTITRLYRNVPTARPSFRDLAERARPAEVMRAVRTTNGGLLVLSLVIGAGAGGGAIVFRDLIKLFTKALSGYDEYSDLGRVANPYVPGLGYWFLILAPVVAGLLYGPLVYFFAREARGHGVPEVMYAVARRGGRIAPQVAAVKALASALCIGGGGSVGREGPIVQIGSALGSTLGRLVKVTESRMRVLVACGAGGGIAATFNAPLAGVFFAMELILRDFTAQSFGMVVLASVMASVIGRAAFGNTSFLTLPHFTVSHPVEYLLFAVLGLVAGLVGVFFSKVLYAIEDICDKLWRGPEWARPAVGGVLLGLLLLALPEMYGVGYPVLGRGVGGGYAMWFLLALLFGKMLATSLTIGIGGSGGVFAPSLFIGAMLGGFYGEVLHHGLPGIAGPVGAYGLIGMGAVFAGAARAPITAVIILFELTGDYSIILPLMMAIALATGISHLVSKDTIYTLKLLRRGVDIDENRAKGELGNTPVTDVMDPVTARLTTDQPLRAAAEFVEDEARLYIEVTDDRGRHVGIVTDRGVTERLSAGGDADTLTVGDAVEDIPTLRSDRDAGAALDLLDTELAPALAVLDADGRAVGWLTHRGVLRALRGGPRPSVPGRPVQTIRTPTQPAGRDAAGTEEPVTT